VQNRGKGNVDIPAKMALSPWFNPALMLTDDRARAQVQFVEQTMDEGIERLVGYGPLHEAPLHVAWARAHMPGTLALKGGEGEGAGGKAAA
jgi:hypothetical protein